MRWQYLAGIFPILIFAVYLIWMFRFERIESIPRVTLEQIRAEASEIRGFEWATTEGRSALRVEMGNSVQPPAGHLRLPGIPAVRSLHLRFRLNTSNLIPGTEKWEDGRVLLDWHAPNDAISTTRHPPTTFISSGRFNSGSGIVDLVVPSPIGPAIPVLRVENLGKSGDLELQDLEITAIRESRIWNIGKWFCFAGWASWVALLVHRLSGAGRERSLLVASAWVAMAAHFAVPGPWQNPRPLISNFRLAKESSVSRPQEESSPSSFPGIPSSGAVAALGKLKDEGSYVLRIKMWLAPMRPILHALLLGIPAMAIGCLVGRKTAWFVMLLLAFLIESAQVAFGFGFDLVDIADVLFDITGIISGLWLGRKLVVYLPIRLQAHLHHSMGGSFASLPSAESALLLQKS